jgi:hypothetical protein
VGYSYAYLGDATLAPERVEGWLAAGVDPAAFEGWPASWRFAAAPGIETVQDVLAALAEEEVQRIEHTGGAIVVRVMADKSMDAWLTYRGALVAAFRQIAAHGGDGELVITGFDDAPFDAGVRVVARADGTSECAEMTPDEIQQVRGSARYADIHALAAKAYGGILEELGIDSDV